ncbi:ATP-binding protein [Mesorhizobium sp. M0808]|uniref:ATP-binding protein n=1 Tax=Mesorhizobium sp. M0808 TaxID=2957002 RepID=UPI003335C56B
MFALDCGARWYSRFHGNARLGTTSSVQRRQGRISGIAKLRFPEAWIEDIDFAAPRGLDRRNTMALAQGEWLRAHDNLIVTGQTGTGKSWLSATSGHTRYRAPEISALCMSGQNPRSMRDKVCCVRPSIFPRRLSGSSGKRA